MNPESIGKVYLVGAGPGDPKLLTLRAAEVLGECDVVLIDRLVNREVLAHARRGARVIDVGKRAGEHAVKQGEICELLVAYAKRGRIVVRLKGGDPFVFGRGGEEALALVEAGIPWEVVPGVSAGVAAAAYAGIPLTHRGVASSVTFRTAHYASTDAEGEGDAQAADGASALRAARSTPDGASALSAARSTPDAGTTVFFMCGTTLAHIARQLVSEGREAATPIAVVRSGTLEDQEVFVGTLADVLAGPIAVSSPALAIVGDVVALQAKLRWFGARTARPLRPSPPANQSPSLRTLRTRKRPGAFRHTRAL